MVSEEIWVFFIATISALISLAFILISWRRQRESVSEKTETINRLLSSTKEETFRYIVDFFEQRKSSFEDIEKELMDAFGKPWFDELADIIYTKVEKKRGQ